MTTDFPPLSGGISTYTKEIASALSKTDNIFLLVPGKAERSSDENNFSFRVIRTPSIPFIRILALFIYLPYLLRQFDIDLVLHTVWPTALCSHLWHFLFPSLHECSVPVLQDYCKDRYPRHRAPGRKEIGTSFMVFCSNFLLFSKQTIEPFASQFIFFCTLYVSLPLYRCIRFFIFRSYFFLFPYKERS